jgi:hypothetical protein
MIEVNRLKSALRKVRHAEVEMIFTSVFSFGLVKKMPGKERKAQSIRYCLPQEWQ